MTAFRVLLLVQGQKCNVETLGGELSSQWVDVLSLTYDEPFQDDQIAWQNLFLPGTTWAEGRNELLSRAGSGYDYYVFCDDDVVFCQGTMDDFCRFLRRHRPYVAVPLTDVISSTGRFRADLSVQRPVAVDQIIQAYSMDAVEDQAALPFATEYDSFGWWVGCEINQHQILSLTDQKILQCNTVMVVNGRRTVSALDSSGYVTKSAGIRRGAGLKLARAFILSSLGPQVPYINSLFHPWWAPRVPLVSTHAPEPLQTFERAGALIAIRLWRRKALSAWSALLWKVYRKWWPSLCRPSQI